MAFGMPSLLGQPRDRVAQGGRGADAPSYTSIYNCSGRGQDA